MQFLLSMRFNILYRVNFSFVYHSCYFPVPDYCYNSTNGTIGFFLKMSYWSIVNNKMKKWRCPFKNTFYSLIDLKELSLSSCFHLLEAQIERGVLWFAEPDERFSKIKCRKCCITIAKGTLHYMYNVSRFIIVYNLWL